MAMSPNELRALLITMDAIIALCKVAKIQGNVELIADVTERFEQLQEIRKLAKGQGLGRETKE